MAEAMRDTPVVLRAGPRQTGKTTRVRKLPTQEGLRYLTLDDEPTLLSAREDTAGMIRSLDRAVIDEIQRAPELLLAIKRSVDEDRRPGRFLLTGSANLMLLPAVADSSAGRMETLPLLPLSQSEIEARTSTGLTVPLAGNCSSRADPASARIWWSGCCGADTPRRFRVPCPGVGWLGRASTSMPLSSGMSGMWRRS